MAFRWVTSQYAVSENRPISLILVEAIRRNQFERYSKAYTSFQRLIEDSDFSKSHTIKFRLQPGDLVLFDNCRMLHGREGFHGDVPGL